VSAQIDWTDGALNQVGRLDRRTRERIVGAVERFAETGYGDLRRVQTRPGELALRVGDWRVFLAVSAARETVRVLRVLPRGRAYRS
jgi:mRNA-degrading endonuclease RelE of RelBE toxin-antitoxin system